MWEYPFSVIDGRVGIKLHSYFKLHSSADAYLIFVTATMGPRFSYLRPSFPPLRKGGYYSTRMFSTLHPGIL